MSNFENFVLLNETNNVNMNCLPIDLKSIPKKYRLVCINTHVMDTLTTSLTQAIAGSLLGAIITRSASLILPTILVYTGITLIPLLSKFDAKDFSLVPKDLNEPFNSTDDAYKVKIVSINDGIVQDIYNSARDDTNNDEKGNFILIKHEFQDHTFYSLYSRLKHRSITVKVGDRVSKGQHIANMGNTGSEKTWLSMHFEMNLIPYFVGKFTENFEPHKYAPINIKELNSGSDMFKKVINKTLETNNNGSIDNFCFLT